MSAEVDAPFEPLRLETIARELEINVLSPEVNLYCVVGKLYLLQGGVAEFVKRSLLHLAKGKKGEINGLLAFTQAACAITQAAIEAYGISGHETLVCPSHIERCRAEIVRSAKVTMDAPNEAKIIDHIFAELTMRQPFLKNYLRDVREKLPDQKIAPSVILSLYAIYVACCNCFDKDRRARYIDDGGIAGISLL